MPTRNGTKTAIAAATAVQPNLGLSEKTQTGVIKLLNARLADTTVLYQKTRNYHWNIKGPRFQPLHAFFESHYDQLEEAIDEIAERIVQLGGVAAGTLIEFVKLSSIKEEPGVVPSENAMIANLLADHETVIRQLRKDIATTDDLGDVGTNDFLTGLIQDHEKMAWMLRAFLQS
jgi:starvation-inducible DNA-binding protein